MTALLKQHEQEVAALEASFEAEEARHTAEINKKLNETHMENVQQAHRALLDKVRSGLYSKTSQNYNKILEFYWFLTRSIFR